MIEVLTGGPRPHFSIEATRKLQVPVMSHFGIESWQNAYPDGDEKISEGLHILWHRLDVGAHIQRAAEGGRLGDHEPVPYPDAMSILKGAHNLIAVWPSNLL